MAYDGTGGWLTEKGWWKKALGEFEDQMEQTQPEWTLGNYHEDISEDCLDGGFDGSWLMTTPNSFAQHKAAF